MGIGGIMRSEIILFQPIKILIICKFNKLKTIKKEKNSITKKILDT